MKKRTQKLNPENFDIQITNDMNSLNYDRKVHPTEVNIIWYLLYNANEQFRQQFQSSIVHLKTKPKENVIDVFKGISFTFEMEDLKEFCNDNEVVKKRLKYITDINAMTNSLQMGIDPLVTLESDPTGIFLINSIDARKGTYTLCPLTLYKILNIPSLVFRPVSLLILRDLPTVKSKAMYQILCTYSKIQTIAGKTLNQWLAVINLKETRNNLNFKMIKINHFDIIQEDIKKHTFFTILDIVQNEDKITITYKGRY